MATVVNMDPSNISSRRSNTLTSTSTISRNQFNNANQSQEAIIANNEANQSQEAIVANNEPTPIPPIKQEQIPSLPSDQFLQYVFLSPNQPIPPSRFNATEANIRTPQTDIHILFPTYNHNPPLLKRTLNLPPPQRPPNNSIQVFPRRPH